MESVRDTVEGAASLGLGALTMFAFSIENWSRPPEEVEVLMELVKRYLRLETENLIANDIRFRPIGRLGELPTDVQAMLQETADATGALPGARPQHRPELWRPGGNRGRRPAHRRAGGAGREGPRTG